MDLTELLLRYFSGSTAEKILGIIVYLNIPSLGGVWGGSLNSLRLHLMTSNQALLYMHPAL